MPLVIAVAACLRAASACSSESPATPPDAAIADAAGEPTADVVVDRAPPPYDADPPPPPGLPDGWVLYRDYAAWCGLYVPSDPKYLPAPIKWMPCEADAGAGCQQMVQDWTKSPSRDEIDVVIGATAGASGPTLMFSRNAEPFHMHVIADADGVVRAAILETLRRSCSLGQPFVSANRYVYRLYEYNDFGGGRISGQLDELGPRLAFQYKPTNAYNTTVGPLGLLDTPSTDTLDLYAWPNGEFVKTIWSSDRDNGLLQNYARFSKDALFWQSGNAATMKLKVYTDAGGVKDFVSFAPDWSRGAADLGTDDVNLVWAQGSGRAKPSGLFPTVDIIVAPYTTDPVALAPRRLRSDTNDGFTASPFTVGCGYAARAGGNAIRVIRLSDGISWVLPGDASTVFNWVEPVAITCTDLFARVHISTPPFGHENIARIRLDSLGPGIVPD